MRGTFLITTILVAVVTLQHASAQLSAVIALDESRSALAYHVQWGEENSYEAKKKARAALKEQGYEKLTSIPCKDCGHDLESGVFVLLKVKYEIYDGSERVGYGLGASSNSFSEAEELAKKNLSVYHSSWKESDGYEVEKKGKFGDGIFSGTGNTNLQIIVFAHQDGSNLKFDRALQLWEHHAAYDVFQQRYKAAYGANYVEKVLSLGPEENGAAVEFSKTVNGKTISDIRLLKFDSEEELNELINTHKSSGNFTAHQILTKRTADGDDESVMEYLLNKAREYLRENGEEVDDSKLTMKKRQACMCIRG